jgi:hypothetical protein
MDRRRLRRQQRTTRPLRRLQPRDFHERRVCERRGSEPGRRLRADR